MCKFCEPEKYKPLPITRNSSELEELRKHETELELLRADNKAYKQRIKELEELNRWRKVSEELPNENDYYLVTNGDFVDFEFGCYNEQDEEWNWDHNGEWKWWMPLPMLPEEGT